jgi:hypothetical protein
MPQRMLSKGGDRPAFFRMGRATSDATRALARPGDPNPPAPCRGRDQSSRCRET